MMDKLDFVINNAEIIKFGFQKNDIEVMQYIPQASMLEIGKDFVNLSLIDSEGVVEGYYSAYWSVIMGILQECTNVNVNEKNFDSIISSGLWDEIRARIKNYEEFMIGLDKILQREIEIRTLESGLGKSLDEITNGVLGFLNKIGELDLSQDGINNLVGKLSSVVKETEEKFPGSTSIVKKPRKKRASKSTE
jgi:hypothetical protein